ncbi:MAG UNVERIFIED_CONTAM: EF-hand domain-containing protein [Anaerolineae bacterium]
MTDFFAKKINHLFDAYDVDQNGLIEFNDFHSSIERMCNILGVRPTSLAYQSLMAVNTRHWELLITLADSNLDDVITREEFLNWVVMAYDMRRRCGHPPCV